MGKVLEFPGNHNKSFFDQAVDAMMRAQVDQALPLFEKAIVTEDNLLYVEDLIMASQLRENSRENLRQTLDYWDKYFPKKIDLLKYHGFLDLFSDTLIDGGFIFDYVKDIQVIKKKLGKKIKDHPRFEYIIELMAQKQLLTDTINHYIKNGLLADFIDEFANQPLPVLFNNIKDVYMLDEPIKIEILQALLLSEHLPEFVRGDVLQHISFFDIDHRFDYFYFGEKKSYHKDEILDYKKQKGYEDGIAQLAAYYEQEDPNLLSEAFAEFNMLGVILYPYADEFTAPYGGLAEFFNEYLTMEDDSDPKVAKVQYEMIQMLIQLQREIEFFGEPGDFEGFDYFDQYDDEDEDD